jgi:hypothetical protein
MISAHKYPHTQNDETNKNTVLQSVSRCCSWCTFWNRYSRNCSCFVARWALARNQHLQRPEVSSLDDYLPETNTSSVPKFRRSMSTCQRPTPPASRSFVARWTLARDQHLQRPEVSSLDDYLPETNTSRVPKLRRSMSTCQRPTSSVPKFRRSMSTCQRPAQLLNVSQKAANDFYAK